MTKGRQEEIKKSKDKEKDFSVLKPQNSEQKIEQPKKKKRGKIFGCFIIFIVVLLILVLLLIAYTGLWNIPVLSQVLGAGKPIDLGVEVTQKAYESAEKKNPMEMKGLSSDYWGARNMKFTGKVDVDNRNTSAEVTSWISHYTQKAPYVSNIQVKYIEGGMEISAFVKPYIKAPVYLKVQVERASNRSVDINLEKAKVGRFPVPSQYYDQIEEIAEKVINNRMNEVPGFFMDVLEYHDGYAILKGTLPKTVEPAEGEWLDIGNLEK